MNNSPLIDVTFISCPQMSGIMQRIHDALKPISSDTKEIIPPLIIDYTKFSNDEYRARIPETVRNTDVLLFHTFHPDPNTSLWKLLLTINALHLALPSSIRLMLPYMPYQRQDRKDEARVPISARVIWKCIEAIGYPTLRQAVTFDMHSEQQQGFTDIPVDNFPANRIHVDYFLTQFGDNLSNVVAVAPDSGAVVRTNRLIERIKKLSGVSIGFGQIRKERPGPGLPPIIKEYKGDLLIGKTVILLDDIIDTAGTIIGAANYVVQVERAATVCIAATHGIFSSAPDKLFLGITSPAEDKLARSGHKVIVTNSIPRDEMYLDQHKSWLKVIPIEKTLESIILQAFRKGGSVSGL